MNEKEWKKLLKELKKEKEKSNKLQAIKILLEHDYLSLNERDKLFNYICELTGLNVRRSRLGSDEKTEPVELSNDVIDALAYGAFRKE